MDYATIKPEKCSLDRFFFRVIVFISVVLFDYIKNLVAMSLAEDPFYSLIVAALSEEKTV